jgi:hypothetical protein
MTRFFFDFFSAASHFYDYHGRTFSVSAEARDMAELIALDLACSDTGNWAGYEVRVRDTAGVTLFSIPVRPAAEPTAA